MKVTNIGHRVGSNILRVDLKAGKYITEELAPRRFKATTHVIKKHYYFTISGGRRVFWTGDSPLDFTPLR